jgi:uncharacterized protein (AIM24 family)
LGALSVSGSCVVVFSGTLDSRLREKTRLLSAMLGLVCDRSVIARLAFDGEGLIGCTYWYTT